MMIIFYLRKRCNEHTVCVLIAYKVGRICKVIFFTQATNSMNDFIVLGNVYIFYGATVSHPCKNLQISHAEHIGKHNSQLPGFSPLFLSMAIARLCKSKKMELQFKQHYRITLEVRLTDKDTFIPSKEGSSFIVYGA